MLTLNEIRNVNFRKSNFGGYRAEDVEAFIDEVQLSYDTLLKENAELVKKLEVLASKLEEYQNEEDSIRNALMNAQKVGDASLRDAKHKAEIILKDATIKAEKIVSNAQAEIHHERDIIERMQRDIAEFKTKLLKAYKDHLTLINNLPNEEIMRPETRDMVNSVQMLDRRASAPVYERQQQPAMPTRQQQAAEAAFEEETAQPEPAPGAPVMPRPERTAQRKGGFTVNIDDDEAAAPRNQKPARRESRFQTSFEDEVTVDEDVSRFAGVKVNAEQEQPASAPASLFKRRGANMQ
ncbi:MAG: DivIVA domain-containing protein [Ruminococcaceae bacterium]|nr:DivIVA domain-containing protein [Oscillospiraceae bacterium]